MDVRSAQELAAGVEQRPRVEVRRSTRRKRTISGRIEDGVLIVNVPAALSAVEERAYVDDMMEKLLRKQRQRQAARSGRVSDTELMRRAERLARAHHLEMPTSIRWVTNQHRRWGSCSVRDRAIRLSHRMQDFPDYVIDAVVVHELAHLTHADHGPGFKALVARYPQLERAEGFLAGFDHRSNEPTEID